MHVAQKDQVEKKKDEPNLQNIKVRTFLVRVWVVGGGGASAGDASVGGASAGGSMLLPVDASPSGVSFLPFPLYVQALASFRHRGVTYRNVCGRRTSSGLLKNVVIIIP